MPLLGKGSRDAIAQLAAWDEQQGSLLTLVMDMAGRIAGFVFWRQGKVADVRAILHLLRLVQRQHVQRGVASHQLVHVVFQQRADHDAGAILLHLIQHLIERLVAGVIHFYLCRRITHGLWLGDGLRLLCRDRSLHRLLRVAFLHVAFRRGDRLRSGRGLHRILERAWLSSDRLGRGQIVGFGTGRAHHITGISGLGDLGGNRAARDGGSTVSRRFKTLLDRAAKDGGLPT